jgi:enamine deaminase RidA (YjgF/YER057c/UK114 family)
MERLKVSTGTKWEPIVGYSRAVRVGPFVYVTGTTAWDDDGNCVGIGDAGAQTQQILKNIGRALHACGAALTDVVRTRIYVTNIERDWEAVGRAHGEVFGEIRPCTTMVEVSGLIAPEYLVEIEADAIVPTALGAS